MKKSAPFICAIISFVIILVSIELQSHRIKLNHENDINLWRTANGIDNSNLIFECETLIQCIDMLAKIRDNEKDASFTLNSDGITHTDSKSLTIAFQNKQNLSLERWFNDHRISKSEYVNLFNKYSIEPSLESVWYAIQSADDFDDFEENDHQLLGIIKKLLPQNHDDLIVLNNDIWNRIVFEEQKPWSFAKIIFVSLFIAITIGGLSMASNFLVNFSCAAKSGFLSYVCGNFLAPQNCKVIFNWKNPSIVGNTVSFTIKFYQRNGRSYPISQDENLIVEIIQGTNNRIPCSIELGGINPKDANKAQVHFAAKRSGDYAINIIIGSTLTHIRGSPFTSIKFLPGNASPQETGFINHCSTVICTEKVPHALFIEMRDKYGNLCTIDKNFDASDLFAVDIIEVSTGKPVHGSFYWDISTQTSQIALVLRLEHEGLYSSSVSYCGSLLKNGDFSIIVLNNSDASLVQKYVNKKSNISFEAKLLCFNNEKLNKPRKVFCYISPKQLIIKEYILKIIPKRLVTFRLCPSTKFNFPKIGINNQNYENSDLSKLFLSIDDGCQPSIEMISDERNVIAATYTQFLLKNIGGSETFKDKQDFFYSEVRNLHRKYFHERYPIRIERENLLESSFKNTKGFAIADWCKSYEIQFLGEQGLDWGGVRREWFEVLCVKLFDPNESGLFHRFKNDKQGLVHPNPKELNNLNHRKLKYYEFAGKIVGKCLYESSLGSGYRQLVKARFSRSFLAQLIGLRVHYKYFEQDDPDLYVSKIKYIIENDVEDMDLNFTEEEYDSNGKLTRVIELIPNGSKIRVNNQNKIQYLDSLAQYRLAISVKDEVEYFLKGLNELIPDNLLCIFDENELELLMCGAGQFSIAEFKANHSVSGASYEFRKILEWFWTAVSNFTDEEMARLLQFTTGCSQLPPGGFSELNPKFNISSSPTFGNLPTGNVIFQNINYLPIICLQHTHASIKYVSPNMIHLNNLKDHSDSRLMRVLKGLD